MKKPYLASSIDSNEHNVSQEVIDQLGKEQFVVDVESSKNEQSVIVYSSSKISLSEIARVLSNFNLKIADEHTYVVKAKTKEFFIKKCIIDGNINFAKSPKNFTDLATRVFKGEFDSNIINSLSISEDLGYLDIGLLKSLISYENQLDLDYSIEAITKTLVANHEIARQLVDYFHVKFAPKDTKRKELMRKAEEKIKDSIDKVQDINEYKILRFLNDINQASIRTNYFFATDLLHAQALAIKYHVEKINSYLSGVQPRFETFVYHNEFVGTHLRKTKVSRGGLRWSDRELDFRNEIKSLMQAQRSKNAVIVPSGSKGGFFIKGNEEEAAKKFERVYKLFISALLDLVDNYENGKAVSGKGVSYDEFDPYFVVAADKGTSEMSDTANAISTERGFWLGDAFASGGSKGFNHKEMGITAKGSLRATERFFIEKNIDIYKDETSVIGIGSPAGDVFGNAMILSKKFILLGAIGSREIFIDPHPNVEKSYKERLRLFNDVLGWNAYDKKIISKGGGIFSRKEKFIKVSPEMKEVFGIKKDTISGEDLAKTLLTMKVDILLNGGVGTYVRGNGESDAEIGDKPNESSRVDVADVRAFSVCEGGNLGFTQKARIDYAKKGGKISADSIDNSAGVNTSDFEVNIKIILNALVKQNKIPESKRLKVMSALVDDVEQRTSKNNYTQALALSMDEIRSKNSLGKFKRTLTVLKDEVDGFVPLEYEIPDVSDFDTQLTRDKKLNRPTLSVMLSFAKIFMRIVLLKDKEFFEYSLTDEFLFDYFPKEFTDEYREQISTHQLREQIIATMIGNLIIDTQGSTFVGDYKELGHKKFMDKVKAFLLINKIAQFDKLRADIYALDLKLEAKKQYEMLFSIEESLKSAIEIVSSKILDADSSKYEKLFAGFVKAHTKLSNKKVALKGLEVIDYVPILPLVMKLGRTTKATFDNLTELFFYASKDLGVLELLNNIKDQKATDEWEEKLKDVLIKEVLDALLVFKQRVLEEKSPKDSMEKAVEHFIKDYSKSFDRFYKNHKSAKSPRNANFISLSVVVGILTKAVNAKN